MPTAPLEVQLNLEPLSFSSPESHELLKVLDNTVAVYKLGKYRTSREIQQSQEILLQSTGNSKDDEGRETLGNNQTLAAADDESLIQYEETLFGISEASNRQLWLDDLRSDTDLFLIFADWAEKQRRKFYDPILRNGPFWDAILKSKEEAKSELTKLFNIFHMLRNPPLSGTPVGPTARHTNTLRQKTRQMTLMASINASNLRDELEQALLCIKLRSERLSRIQQSVENTTQLIKEGVEQQKIFLFLIDELRSKWNVVKIPYESQVFSGADTDYPYRGELWIELLHIPSDVWGIDMLDDPSFNAAPQLWQSADAAGYQVHLHCDNEDINSSEPLATIAEQAESHQDSLTEWREKRVRRRFGNPFHCSPPVPVSPPFNTQWVEIYIAAKKDEEKLPSEATEFLHGKRKKRKSPVRIITEVGDANGEVKSCNEHEDIRKEGEGVNIIAKFNGDMGAAVREGRRLTCEISLKSVRWISGQPPIPNPLPTEPPLKKQRKAQTTSAGTTTFTENSMMENANDPYISSRRTAREVFKNLNDYLLVAQRTCLERTLYAIIQAQGMRMLRELTFPLIDDENLNSVTNLLRSRVASIEPIDNVGIMIRPLLLKENSEFACDPCLRPNHFSLPVSWACWPILAPNKHNSPGILPRDTNGGSTNRDGGGSSKSDHTRLHYLAGRKRVIVTACDSESVSFAFNEIPIFIASSKPKSPPQAIGECDVLVTIKFSNSRKLSRRRRPRQKKTNIGEETSDPVFRLLFEYLEAMSVCKLRQLFLETLYPVVQIFPMLQFDLHRTSLPATRSMDGPRLLNDFHSWLFSQISMGFYKPS
eukprot:Gregarina_sp_Poly_1__3798@NODE_212_length_11327_cov_84_360924_g188_i0_p1_GENE_NODE_212_length_11327_cov_84_360924_g188_i0NODE_212_length_11327_cov_84_360924_g188_i0_p1_ORF_typecomplete_len821_score85_43Moulting_cycle/PF04870_16/1_6e02Moulting_cycle/PF04870_16/0_25_NODE_212_length_11327_cov_84_360924_g188_i037976259